MELLWMPPVLGAFPAGALLIPRTGSGWLDALLWLGFGAVLMGLLFLLFRIMRHTPANGMPVRAVFFLTVFFSAQRLIQEGSMDHAAREFVLAGTIVPLMLLAEYVASRRNRRAAAPGAP